jgi:hypothetical protein
MPSPVCGGAGRLPHSMNEVYITGHRSVHVGPDRKFHVEAALSGIGFVWVRRREIHQAFNCCPIVHVRISAKDDIGIDSIIAAVRPATS